MHQHWQTLNTILDSVTALQENRYHSIDSPEIKESAKNFETSLKPCLQELSASSIKLASLLEKSLKELQQTEDIWLSKAKIANADTAKIWQEITKLTGYYLKIKQLGNESKEAAIDKAEKTCTTIFKQLVKRCFCDSKPGIKQRIGWGDKERFNILIRPKLNNYDHELNKIISEKINLLFENFKRLDFEFLICCCSLFDKHHKKKYILKKKVFLDKVDNAIDNPDYIDGVFLLDIAASFNKILNDWQKRFGDIYWKEVSKLEQQVISKSKSRIEMVIDDRVKLASSIIEEMIAFYSQLLDKQNRYLQETAEQRLAEKHWIDQQKETLGKMQADIRSILEDND